MHNIVFNMLSANILAVILLVCFAIFMALRNKTMRTIVYCGLVFGVILVGVYYLNKCVIKDEAFYLWLVGFVLSISTMLGRITTIINLNLVLISRLSLTLGSIYEFLMCNIVIISTVCVVDVFSYVQTVVVEKVNYVIDGIINVVENTKEKIEYKNNLSSYSFVYRL